MFWHRKRAHTPIVDDEPDAESGLATGSRRGQAFVELALSMPLMLLIMLGTLDVGQVFVDYIQLRNGCREAASYGARDAHDPRERFLVRAHDDRGPRQRDARVLVRHGHADAALSGIDRDDTHADALPRDRRSVTFPRDGRSNDGWRW